MIKKIFIALLIVFIALQFFHPEKNIDDSNTALSNDVSKIFPMEENVQNILKTSCYDCHSNNTKYPWYSKVQPVAWWLNDHIKEGKKEINFNEFATYSLRRQYKKFEEIVKQIKQDEMPLASYTLIHRDAVLAIDQKLAVSSWANAAMESMKAKYPADSLKRK
jgi:hypothetical protein